MATGGMRRRKQTTNDFYRSVLDEAVREKWQASEKKPTKKKLAASKRLSSLYGCNSGSKHVRRRTSMAIKPLGPLSPTGKEEEATFAAPVDESFKRKSIGYSRKQSQAVIMSLNSSSGSDFALQRLGIPRSSSASSMMRSPPPTLDAVTEEPSAESRASGARRRAPARGGGAARAPTAGAAASRARVQGARPRTTAGRPSMTPGSVDVPGDGEAHPGLLAPPWYLGYKNSTRAPPSSPFTQASRYGFSGTLSLERLKRPNSSSIDFGARRPKFLGAESIVNEYTPVCRGSPSLWPNQARYVTGSTLKTLPPRPVLTAHMRKWVEKDREEVERLNAAVRAERVACAAERKREHTATLPVKVPAFMVAAKRRGAKTRAPLPTDEFGRVRRGRNNITADARRMKYWRGLTVMYAKQEDEHTLRERIEKQQKDRTARLEMKWREQVYLFKLVKSSGARKPGLADFNDLMHEFKFIAEDRNNGELPGRSINRDDFVAAVMAQFEVANRKKINRLYSSFDLASHQPPATAPRTPLPRATAPQTQPSPRL